MTVMAVVFMAFFFIRLPFSQIIVLFIGIFIGNLSIDITQILAIKSKKVKRFFGISVDDNKTRDIEEY
jgi:chromate transport protein ChrA